VRRHLCAALFCVLALPAGAQDFSTIFGARYQEAVAWILERAGTLREALDSRGVDARTLVPVVFPEVLRFSLIRDRVETLGLETLYVSQGAAYADFSIGRFQMKPSFVERLEIRLPDLAGFGTAASARGVRALRVERLRDDAWQARYLAAFGSIAEADFPCAGTDTEARIRFLAAAYNHGFWRSRSEIEAAESWRLFPSGASSPYRYADVAVDFYRRIWKTECESVGIP
jgi:hypothetical protein